MYIAVVMDYYGQFKYYAYKIQIGRYFNVLVNNALLDPAIFKSTTI